VRPFWRLSDFWYLYQCLIIFAFVGSNIHWEWAPKHSFVPLLFGAFVASWTSVWIAQLWGKWRAREPADGSYPDSHLRK
jgi:hypothetical protein